MQWKNEGEGLFQKLIAQGIDSFVDGYDIVFSENVSKAAIISLHSNPLSALSRSQFGFDPERCLHQPQIFAGFVVDAHVVQLLSFPGFLDARDTYTPVREIAVTDEDIEINTKQQGQLFIGHYEKLASVVLLITPLV